MLNSDNYWESISISSGGKRFTDTVSRLDEYGFAHRLLFGLDFVVEDDGTDASEGGDGPVAAAIHGLQVEHGFEHDCGLERG